MFSQSFPYRDINTRKSINLTNVAILTSAHHPLNIISYLQYAHITSTTLISSQIFHHRALKPVFLHAELAPPHLHQAFASAGGDTTRSLGPLTHKQSGAC